MKIADTIYVHKEIADYIMKDLKENGKEGFVNLSNRLICAMVVGEQGEPKYDKTRKSIDEILHIINND